MNKKGYIVIAGVVVAAVVLSVLFCVVLVNHRPIISGLAAQAERILPRGSCEIVCNATDPDGDTLTYGWSANGGTITGEGSTVTWTAPDSAGSYNVTVIVADTHGGAATGDVTVTVRTNRSPSIRSLEADADWTLPSGSVDVTCDASDPDNDELAYEWSASGGGISGTGAEVVWTAPQEVGVYYITVLVKDRHGSSDTRIRSLTATPGEPPTIEELVITKDRYGHCYLKAYSGGYYVGKDKPYDIECVVSDTGIEVSYEWSCTGGEISESFEDGSMIAWTAPDTSIEVTITGIVSDTDGNIASKDLFLNVVSCSTCTFGSCSTG